MAYHSSFNNKEAKLICGFPLLRVKDKSSIEGDEDDIVDEAIKFFRINVLFKNFDILAPADKLLIFLTVYISHCLNKVADTKTEDECKKILDELARDGIPKPSDPKFFMNSIFTDSKDAKELDEYQAYLKKLKDLLGSRLLKILYTKEGRTPDFKFWIGYSKRKFLGLTYNYIFAK